MKAKIEYCTAKNPNPVLNIGKDGTVLYSNEAGEPLLNEWGVGVGEKLPSNIGDLVQRVISRNSPERMEVKAGKRIYLVAFHPISEVEHVNIYGFDISDQKKLEGKLRESEAQEKANLELAKIIDAQAVQSLMNDFNKLVHIPMGLNDLKGNVLVSAGWQEICTKFHRVNPEACKHCIESDINLSTGVAPGEYKLYKCKNNMWDVVTPIMVEGQKVGNIFSGQFFFDDEPLDYELFRSQARKYGFNEEEYIKALEKVPRFSRETVDTSMAFFMTFANMISQLSYSNIKLSKFLVERDALVEALQESEKRFRTLAENSPDLIARFDRQNRHIYVNPAAAEVYGLSQEEIIGKTHSELGRNPKQIKFWEKHNEKVFTTGKTETMEFQYTSPQGKKYYFNTRTVPEFFDGKITSVLAISRDITDIKEAESKLKETLDNLEILVEERTTQLKDAYKSLKEIEEGLAEAQKMAHLGNWDWNLLTGEMYWSNEMYHMFGCTSRKLCSSFNDVLSHTHPDDREYVDNTVKRALKGKPFDIDHRIISADGEERVVNAQGEVTFDKKNTPIRMRGTVQDITERKRAEEKIQSLANIVESSKDAIITQSFGIITSWNKGAEQVYGYSAKEILGEPVSILEPDGLKGEIKQLDEMIKQGEEIHNYETSRLRKDGKLINVSITLSPIFDASGKLTAISAIARDITKSKISEEKMRESEEKYRNIVETANEGIYLVNDESKITYANKIMETSGYTLKEIIGRSTWDFISEESKPVAKMMHEKMRQGVDVSYELKLIRKDGSYIWGFISAKPFFDGTVFTGYLAMLTDITERKEAEEKLRESEEKYRNIVEIANEGIWTVDAELRITYANKRLVDMLGYSQKEIIGRYEWDFADEENQTAIKLNLDKRRRGIAESYEIKFVRKDGSPLWTIINDKPLFDDDGKFKGSLGMLTDITERKETEETLANIETARKKEIHHRIKNNLQVISSLLDLQADKFNDTKVVEAFRESQNRVISMALIHEELYKEKGTDTLNFSEYLKTLAATLFQTYKVSSKNIHLNMDLEENAFFDMDIAVPLGIIVNELVSNSLKHAFPGRDKGDIQIKLHSDKNKECKREDFKSTNFILTVSDNGMGIPENLEIEDLDTLGMQLVTSLVDQLDGELEMKRDNGTEFTIRFTVIEKDNQASALVSQQLIE